MEIPPWLEDRRRELGHMLERRHAPQALLIHGIAGTGRRYLALWFAAQLLRVPGGQLARFADGEPGEETEPELGHPDFMMVRPPAGKAVIPVELIRELTAFLQLRSHQGGARAAVIWPAEAMNPAAANSLLKTLEEPPPASTIVLVASAPARLPPTILSRCHRLRVAPPTRPQALQWLNSRAGTGLWDAVLDLAGGAPLRALALHQAGASSQVGRYAQDLESLRARRDSPAAVARRWAATDPELLGHWLYLQASASVRGALTGDGHGSSTGPLQNPAKPTNIRLPLERLGEVEALYRNRSRSLTMELQLAALLQGWHGDGVPGGER